MIKTKCLDKEEFVKNIMNLLTNKKLYNKESNDAHKLIKEIWDWDKRSEMILNRILKGVKNGRQ
jgi:hypothetical protein